MKIESSSSSYVNGSYASKGFSGLASGLDTESMVQELLSGTQSKIDKQEGAKQQLQWKQDLYRSIIQDILDFKSKYFDRISSTSLLSNNLYNAMTAIGGTSAVKATATTSAATGSTRIEVAQLATSSFIKSSGRISGVLAGDIDLSQLDRSVTFEVTDGSGTREVAVDLNGAATEEEIVQRLEDALGSDVSVSMDEGKLSITAESGVSKLRVSSKSTALGLGMIGLSAGASSETQSTDDGEKAASLSGKVNADGKLSLNVHYNGVKKTITIDTNQITDAQSLRDQLQQAINKAHGTGIQVSLDNGRISFKGSDSGQEISISGNASLLKAMGISDGQSTKINGQMKLSDISFSSPLQGSQFSFSINGTEFSYSADATLNDIISDINSSDAGVRLTFDSMADTFKMESTSTGEGFDITMSQSEGNLLTALFGSGVNAGSKMTGDVLTTKAIDGGSVGNVEAELNEATFTFTVNGSKQTISFPKRKEGEDTKPYTRDELMTLLDEELEKRFGYTDSGERAIQLDTTGGNASLKVNNGAVVSFEKSNGGAGDLASALGFASADAEKSNRASGDMTLKELGITGLAVDENTKLSDLASVSGGRYSFNVETGKITVDGSVGGNALSSGEKAFFGAAADAELGDGTSSLTLQKGKNAVVSINGVWTERATNSFTANGIYFDLRDTTGSYKTDANGDVIVNRNADGSIQVDAADGASNTATVIEVERNTDQIYDKITGFVKDYNELIEKLNGYIDEDATYKEYAPLTSDQKKEMSDREIELWEEKAKGGLLRRDNAITTFLSEMRQALYERPTGSSIALYDIGIETSDNWRDKGKLVINETALRSAIEQKPNEVMNLFTSKEGGVANRLNDIIYKTANDTSGSPGTLVQIAGMKNRATASNNALYNQMKKIDEQIEKLKNQYNQQKTRYWNQFNAMEKMISQMNSQSAWLSQQLG